jgi:hypothetical protein
MLSNNSLILEQTKRYTFKRMSSSWPGYGMRAVPDHSFVLADTSARDVALMG